MAKWLGYWDEMVAQKMVSDKQAPGVLFLWRDGNARQQRTKQHGTNNNPLADEYQCFFYFFFFSIFFVSLD